MQQRPSTQRQTREKDQLPMMIIIIIRKQLHHSPKQTRPGNCKRTPINQWLHGDSIHLCISTWLQRKMLRLFVFQLAWTILLPVPLPLPEWTLWPSKNQIRLIKSFFFYLSAPSLFSNVLPSSPSSSSSPQRRPWRLGRTGYTTSSQDHDNADLHRHRR